MLFAPDKGVLEYMNRKKKQEFVQVFKRGHLVQVVSKAELCDRPMVCSD